MKATTPIPQITLKAFVFGVILAAVLAGANAYLGLFAGMTVSSAIAAAGVGFMVPVLPVLKAQLAVRLCCRNCLDADPPVYNYPVPGEYLHEGRGAQLYLRWSQPFR